MKKLTDLTVLVCLPLTLLLGGCWTSEALLLNPENAVRSLPALQPGPFQTKGSDLGIPSAGRLEYLGQEIFQIVDDDPEAKLPHYLMFERISDHRLIGVQTRNISCLVHSCEGNRYEYKYFLAIERGYTLEIFKPIDCRVIPEYWRKFPSMTQEKDNYCIFQSRADLIGAMREIDPDQQRTKVTFRPLCRATRACWTEEERARWEAGGDAPDDW